MSIKDKLKNLVVKTKAESEIPRESLERMRQTTDAMKRASKEIRDRKG